MLRQSTLLLLAFATASFGADSDVTTIKTLRSQMRYDTEIITAAAGSDVKIHFENGDDMPHNIVFCQPGTDVVALSNKQMEKPEEAMKRNFLPDDPAVWQHSKLLNPNESQDLAFKAPDKSGDYPFVCTMPGHAMMMRGILRVFNAGFGLTNLKYKFYQGNWSALPDFNQAKLVKEGEVESNQIEIKLDDYQFNFGIVYTGSLNAPKAGDYTFALSSDDGARIFIDGEPVVSFDGVHAANDIQEGKVHLEQGSHQFRLDYFQHEGEAQIYVGWKGPDFAITPLSKWTHPNWNGTQPKKESKPGLVLEANIEPIIYRNFIAGAGNRGIGVGYPGKFNIAWSAESMNAALVWRGAFIDASKHWVDRGGGFQPPLGYDVCRPSGDGGLPFAVLASPETEWPRVERGQRAAGYAWKGYRLDAKRIPTFMYEWSGLKVADRFDATGDATEKGAFVRTVRSEGAIPKDAFFRVAFGEKIEPQQGNSYLVEGGALNLEGRDFGNKFVVTVDGAKVVGRNLLVPARAEIKISYSWPEDHSQHVHAQ